MTPTTDAQSSFPSDTLDRMARDDRWLGFGYLGEMFRHAESVDPGLASVEARRSEVAEANRLVLAHAAERRWSHEQLFAWANSKHGRWYGDAMFGRDGAMADRFALAQRWGVLDLPQDES